MARAPVSTPLADPLRLASLRGTGLLASPPEDAFDRLASLAAKVLGAPIGMVSLLDDRHLHVKACVGLPQLAKARRLPVVESFCRHVVIGDEPLVVADAREHELTRDLTMVNAGKVLAYAGVPLKLHGFVLGALSVADAKPRAWKVSETELLRDLAACVVTEIELRSDVEARKRAEADLQRATDRLRGLLAYSPAAIYAKDLERRYLFVNPAAERLLGVPAENAVGRRDAQLHSPTVAAALCAHDEAVIAGGGPVEIEETLELGGRSASCRTVRFPLTDEAGEPYGVCAISTDLAAPATATADLDVGVLQRLTADTDSKHESQQIARYLAGMFREDSRRGLKQVADALRQKDAQGVARAAQALKDSSGQLGATRTEAISAELEAVAVSGELSSAKALLRRLEAAVDAAQSALSSTLPDGAAK
jgi:PAS domain S-box-containing protein